KNLAKVRFHHGTSEILCRVALLGQATVEPGGACFAQLRLEQPVAARAGDSFILRDFSPVVTLGGGTALDSQPQKTKRTDQDAVACLSGLERSDTRERLAAFIRQAETEGLPETNLVARSGLTRAALADHLARLEKDGRIRVLMRQPFYVVDADAYRALC